MRPCATALSRSRRVIISMLLAALVLGSRSPAAPSSSVDVQIETTTAGCSALHRRHVHETGHVLCGHLVGLDVDHFFVVGEADGESAVSFSFGGAAASMPADALPALAVAAMGGVAAEYVVCGDQLGGTGDMAKLIELVGRHHQNVVSGEEWLLNSTRIAMQMIQNHIIEFQQAVARMAKGASVGACVAAVDAATTVPWWESVSRHYPHVRGRSARAREGG